MWMRDTMQMKTGEPNAYHYKCKTWVLNFNHTKEWDRRLKDRTKDTVLLCRRNISTKFGYQHPAVSGEDQSLTHQMTYKVYISRRSILGSLLVWVLVFPVPCAIDIDKTSHLLFLCLSWFSLWKKKWSRMMCVDSGHLLLITPH